MYSEEEKDIVFNNIIEDIENGLSLRKSLEKDKRPNPKTFYEWIDNNEVRCKQYARACSIRADAIFDEILEIADTTEEGSTITESDKGTFTNTGDMIQHRRLKVDARKWMLSKMVPKKYGDSQQIKITDNDGDPLKINAIFSTDILNVSADNSIKEDS